jgi:hypothetical protein
MRPRDQRDRMKVLAVLKDNPRFSVFDATERDAIALSLDDLRAQGLIEYVKPGPAYPWCLVRVTKVGDARLRAWRDEHEHPERE